VPPPALYATGFAAGLLVQRWRPAGIGGGPATTVAGALLLAGGIGCTAAGVATVVRHGTTVLPHHPVSSLVTAGPYRVSRNPMYAGMAIAYAGGALLARTYWPLAFLPSVLLVVQRRVIQPEERYLAERFGAAYADYRARVRRWL